MSVTSDFSSTANDNDARERAERAMRNFDTPPRSPYEALEPVRPPEFPEREPWRMHPVLAFFNALFMLDVFHGLRSFRAILRSSGFSSIGRVRCLPPPWW